MGIPNKQIGWSNESNLLWQIAKQIDYLTKVTAKISTEVTVINDVTDPVPVEVENEIKAEVINTVQAAIVNDNSSPVPVTGPLTDTQLRASTVNVSPNITRGGGVTDANTQRVTLASDGPGVQNLATIASNTNVSKNSGVIDSTTQRVVVASDQIVPVSPRANTTGSNGTTPYKLISTSSTNANVIKNSGGNLYSIIAIGLTSTVRYLKLYNKATTPTVGTDVPLMTIPVPANTQGAGISIPFSMGANFPLGIGVAITSGSADNDTGAVGAGDVILNITYA